jgi:23S rRNA (adenine1618-N6)-methyltransferase
MGKTQHAHSTVKVLLHPRNRNNRPYDFPELLSKYPELTRFVLRTKYGKDSIDFADPAAVRMLNTILLRHHYGIVYWELPEQYLCPPIPGRADYLHYAADLLAAENNGIIPRGRNISVLDIGTGANCIYPMIGNAEYGWMFTGTDIDPESIRSAQHIIDRNPGASKDISLRLQPNAENYFTGTIRENERFDLTICNPPFHSSMEQATAGTKRKWKNLGAKGPAAGILNFGGRHHELVYPGGELNFVTGMIKESTAFADTVLWFSTLISRQSNLPLFREELHQVNAEDVRTIDMAQGQKKSRILAWTFHPVARQNIWIKERWSSE